MCGLVGVITPSKFGMTHLDVKIFKQLLYIDALRGWDSVGIFSVNNLGSVSVSKSVSKVQDFVDTKQVSNTLQDAISDGKFLIGHNRSATKGEVNEKNAHPFTAGSVTLVHNGTLFTHKNLHDCEVDSEAITNSIAKVGYVETLKKLDGAFALIWYDMNSEALYFTRNSKRPLNIVKSGTGTIYIASEAGMLEFILGRNNVSYKEVLNVNDETKDDVGTVFKYDLEGDKLSSEKVDFFVPKVATSYHNYRGYGGYYNGMGEYYGDNDDDPPVTVSPVSKEVEIISSNVNKDQLNSMAFWSKNNKKRVIFELDDFKSMPSNSFKCTGYIHDIPVEFLIQDESSMLKLFNYQFCEGELDGFPSSLGGNVAKIYVKNVKPFLFEVSKNGAIITPKVWDTLKDGDHVCNYCGGEISTDDIAESIVRVKQDGTIRKMVCKDCIILKEVGYAN